MPLNDWIDLQQQRDMSYYADAVMAHPGPRCEQSLARQRQHSWALQEPLQELCPALL